MEKSLHWIYRAAFTAGAFLALLAVAEGVAQLFGHSLVRGDYGAGRLLEFAAILMTFVIALELRGIRELLKPR